MRRTPRKLSLRPETIRTLTDLGSVHGGHPTSWPFCLGAQAARAATSEQGGDDFPCPGDYSWTCKP
jgi:hypothetical protein